MGTTESAAILALFAARLKQERANRGLTQKALAARAGIGNVYISKLESGQKSPTLGTLDALARALGCRAADLLQPPKPRRGKT